MNLSPGFLKCVEEARPRVRQVTVQEAGRWLSQNPEAILLDVREDSEWELSRATRAVHLGKGVLERDIEKPIPNNGTEIIMYCEFGYRSILAADSAMQLGYSNVVSIIGA